MPDKQKNAKSARKPKTSAGSGRGARKTHLTDLQVVLMTGNASRAISRAGLHKAKLTDGSYRRGRR